MNTHEFHVGSWVLVKDLPGYKDFEAKVDIYEHEYPFVVVHIPGEDWHVSVPWENLTPLWDHPENDCA